jgi:hypothetical protein
MSSAVTKEKELYSGKTSGLTFETFDEKVITWCRKTYGDAYAVGLWKNELDDIYNLDLADDEDCFAFELQCAKVRYPMPYIRKECRSLITFEVVILDEEVPSRIPAVLSRTGLLLS